MLFPEMRRANSSQSYTRVDCVACKTVSKKAQTNLHAWAHRGLLIKEAGRLPPTITASNIQTCQWTCLLTVQLLKVSSGDAGLIGRHNQVGCQSKRLAGTRSVVSLAVAGTNYPASCAASSGSGLRLGLMTTNYVHMNELAGFCDA